MQSSGRSQNTTGLVQRGGEGSPGFFLLLRDLRELQIAGGLGIRLQQTSVIGADGKPTARPDQVCLSLGPEPDPALRHTADELRGLPRLPPGSREAQVVYGDNAHGRGELAILNRSILGVLSQLAVQAEVPAADVALG